MPSLKPMLRHATLVLVLGAALAASFVGAFHDPQPHHMPVGVVAPAAQVARLDARVAAHAPGALALRPYPSAAAAATAIEHRAIDGAIVLGPARAHLLVASAAGAQTVATMQRAFTPASLRMPVVTEDLAPLPASDRAGLGPFFFVLTLLIPSVLIGVALTVVVKDMPVTDRLIGAATFAVALAAIDALLSNVAFGALGGGFLQLVGVGALISFAASSVTVGLGRLLGPLGVAVAVLGLLIVGVPASGAAVGPAFLPGFYAALHPILPMGQGLDAVRNAVYFSGHATADKLWLLGGWALLGIVLSTIGTRWSLPELVRRRSRSAAPVAPVSDAANMAAA